MSENIPRNELLIVLKVDGKKLCINIEMLVD